MLFVSPSSLMRGFIASVLLCGGFTIFSAGFAMAQTRPPVEINTNAFYVDSSVCTVVIKASVEPGKPIQPGTPIDQLASLPAICTSSMTGQNTVQGGVRSQMNIGFRITGVSHAVTPLGILSDGRQELLISMVIALERPQTVAPTGVPPRISH